MKAFNSIIPRVTHTCNGRIITFGLSQEENILIENMVDSKNIEVYETNVASDLVALRSTAIVVNAKKLEADDLELLENYYTELGPWVEEIVFWIGSPKPTIELQILFKCFDKFDDMITAFEKIVI